MVQSLLKWRIIDLLIIFCRIIWLFSDGINIVCRVLTFENKGHGADLINMMIDSSNIMISDIMQNGIILY